MNCNLHLSKRSVRAAFIVAIAVAAAPLLAIQPSHWVHTSETDFEGGMFTNVVSTNFGDLKLSRSVKTLLEQDSRISAVYAMAQAPDGTIYAATGPGGVLLAIQDDVISDAAVIGDGSSLFCVTVAGDGSVLFGTGGDFGKVYRIIKPGDSPKEVFAADDVQYVWGIYPSAEGAFYVATGPTGQLFEVKEDGTPAVILDSNENNLLSLVGDGKETLYVGTDPHGLIYRVNTKTRETFVIHDAAESEITTMALASDGTLYAGTAESLDAAMGALEMGEEAVGGRPESTSGAMPIPAEPPDEPDPPEVPDPNPVEPDPIPKEPASADPALHWRDHSARPMRIWTVLQEEPAPEPPEEAPEPPDAPPAAPGEGEMAETVAPVAPPPPDLMSQGAGEARIGGNAVYRISPTGFVTEIFRDQVLVLSMLEKDGILTLGTGSEGRVYQVNPAAEETVVLAKLEPKQVMALCRAKDGRLLLGLANTGGISVMTPGYASVGTYTSPVLDASQVSRFGQMHLYGRLPKNTELLVATRSGNLSEPQETGWSKWSKDAPANEYMEIQSPAARFLQYRLTFKSVDGETTPVIDEADIAYQLPNLPPKITSVTLASAEADPSAAAAFAEAGLNSASTARGSGKQTITWTSEDPNLDSLRYSIYFRSGSRAPWILLEESVSETTHEWETRGAADGRYEIKVVASDKLANPIEEGRTASRVSDPFIVDNTAPVVGDLKSELNGKSVTISTTAVDRSSSIFSFEYSVDSSEDWQAVLPSDNICDGPQESTRFEVSDLDAGVHQIAIRCTDARGNRAIRTVSVTVD